MNSKKNLLISLFFFGSVVLFQCTSEEKKTNSFVEKMDQRTKLRYRQYMVSGKGLYEQHCANCHGDNGEGLEQLIPPLAKSDYLMSDVTKTVCIIKNGQEGDVIVNGITYNQPMPAHDDLRALEIAEIITYITNVWGNENGLFSAKEAEKVLNLCAQTN